MHGGISQPKGGDNHKKMLDMLCETVGELEEPLKKLAEIAHRGQINVRNIT